MSGKNAVYNVLENVKDAASEARHRLMAKAEELKLASIAGQAKNQTQANIDRAKRDIRNTDKK